jgi:hypothetical protein
MALFTCVYRMAENHEIGGFLVRSGGIVAAMPQTRPKV